ncbi:MAG TPA: hypothetical protein VGV86_02370, partial [Acidimicrobiales bacterium]|nr:hypothetical protein [Acidimicrobiales bacterium]
MRQGRVAVAAVVAVATLAACGGGRGGTDGDGREAAGAVISVFNRLASADGERLAGGDAIRPGAVLSTDSAGAATFSVGKKLDDCQIRPDSVAQVLPEPGVLLDYQRGWTLCRTTPGDTDRAELTARNLRITMHDPVWAVGAVDQAVVTRVFRGFVEVAATTGPGRLLGPDSESTASDGREPAPAQPFDRALLDPLDRQGVDRMEATLPAPSFGFPPTEGSAALTEIRRRGTLRLGVDSARTAQAAAFIGAYFDFLSEHWGVRIDVVASRRPAADLPGKVDVAIVRPPAGAAQIPFFDDEQQSRWSMAVADDEPALLAALRTFLLGALEIGEYGRRYLSAFGTVPSYEAVRPLVLPDGQSAAPPTTSSVGLATTVRSATTTSPPTTTGRTT